MKQPEWQRGWICGALSSKSQQLNLEPSELEQREREIYLFACSNIFYNQIQFLVYVAFYNLQSLIAYSTIINNNSYVHSLLQSMFGGGRS